MARGDTGGAVTELAITCQTALDGEVDIAKRDAVRVVGPYTVTNDMDIADVVFGQALSAADANGEVITVKARGICCFTYDGQPPVIGGSICGSDYLGHVRASADVGVGIVLKVCEQDSIVHVLI